MLRASFPCNLLGRSLDFSEPVAVCPAAQMVRQPQVSSQGQSWDSPAFRLMSTYIESSLSCVGWKKSQPAVQSLADIPISSPKNLISKPKGRLGPNDAGALHCYMMLHAGSAVEHVLEVRVIGNVFHHISTRESKASLSGAKQSQTKQSRIQLASAPVTSWR